MNDTGLSTDWKVGALNSITQNLEKISIKLDVSNTNSLINNFCFCLINFFITIQEGFFIINIIKSFGSISFTIRRSYTQQIP